MPRADSRKPKSAILPVPSTPPPAAAEKRASESRGVTDVQYDPNDQKGYLQPAGGSRCDAWNNLIIEQAIKAVPLYNNLSEGLRAERMNSVVGAMVGIDPKDELEGMLAAQLIASHSAGMDCYRRAKVEGQTFDGRREELSQANKLSRTYVTLLEALNRHRGKGQQKMTVEHVHVYEGGQAIVGNVEHPQGGPKISEVQPHAQIPRAAQPTVRSEDAQREALPVAGNAERTLPHARRTVTRRTKGE